jgi:Meiotically up-regulated gene 113
MEKQHIINEIHRTAKNGKAIGQRLFFKETGIKVDDWRGKYWARWGDALVEAGYSENVWNPAHEEGYIFQSLLQLIRKLGKVPTKSEIQLEKRSNSDFPSIGPIQRLGSKAALITSLLEYCCIQEGYEDVEQILKATPIPAESKELPERPDSKFEYGYVYLILSARKYKIGYSKAALSRASVVSNLSPEGGEIIHLIRTDDMRGIEAYWHNRFSEKRGNGEWFSLSASDVAAFKRRKFM